MIDASQIGEHFEVVGADGQHVGTVDHVLGDKIELTKKDPAAEGHHHLIPVDWAASVAGNTVTLAISAHEAMERWERKGLI
jgi:hypothetical protein